MADFFDKNSRPHELGGTLGNDRIFGSGSVRSAYMGGDGNDEISPGRLFINPDWGPSQFAYNRVDTYGGIGNAAHHDPRWTFPTSTIGGLFRDGNDLMHIGPMITSDGGSGRDTYLVHTGTYLVHTGNAYLDAAYKEALQFEVKSFNVAKDKLITPATDDDQFHFYGFLGPTTVQNGQKIYHLREFHVEGVNLDNPDAYFNGEVRTVFNAHEPPNIPEIPYHGTPQGEIQAYLHGLVHDGIIA